MMSVKRYLTMNVLVIIVLTVFRLSAAAQTADLPDTPIRGTAAGFPPLAAKPGMVAMRVEEMDAQPAKGLPFCAVISTEHTQVFADGNRVHTSDNSTLCRDSEGRTRREASLNLLGTAQQMPAPKLITIVDPVAGFRYMLDSESKIAHRTPIASTSHVNTGVASVDGPSVAHGKPGQVMVYQHVDSAGPNMVVNDNVFFKKTGQAADGPAPATENLGDQSIDGIHVTGTRMTTTIPAGKMGNELPILVTSERWYSPELKVTVMTKHNDPWAGELKTQFTNVSTSEPDSSLFSVPSDYKLVEEKNGPFTIQKRLLPDLPPLQ